jgi:hypothetical protein
MRPHGWLRRTAVATGPVLIEAVVLADADPAVEPAYGLLVSTASSPSGPSGPIALEAGCLSRDFSLRTVLTAGRSADLSVRSAKERRMGVNPYTSTGEVMVRCRLEMIRTFSIGRNAANANPAVQRPATRLGPGRAIWLALLTVIGVLATSCSSDDTYLPTLLEDPIASYEAEGIVLVDSWERAEGRDLFFRTPTHAEVVRSFRIVDQSRSERVLEEAAAYAEANGWRLAPARTSPATGYRGAKQLAPGDARLVVSLGAADPLHDPDGPRVLRIHLDFGPVRFDGTTTTSVVEGG